MTAAKLQSDLEAKGAVLWIDGDRLRVGPSDRLTDEDRDRIRQHRDALYALVSGDAAGDASGYSVMTYQELITAQVDHADRQTDRTEVEALQAEVARRYVPDLDLVETLAAMDPAVRRAWAAANLQDSMREGQPVRVASWARAHRVLHDRATAATALTESAPIVASPVAQQTRIGEGVAA
jgi:TubC N-terminal docking domain